MLEKFLDMGIKLISITDGADGSIISDGKTIVNSGTYPGQIQDTTGAGDAFLSGILMSTLNNYDIVKMSKVASAMAKLECMEVGVREGLPHNLGEIEDFMNNNELKQVVSKVI